MEWSWLAASLSADRVLFAIFYATAGVLCWDYRHQGAALGARLAGALAAWSTRIRRQRFDKRAPETIAEAAWVQERMEQMRIQNYSHICKIIVVVATFAIVVMSFCWGRIATRSYYNGISFLTVAIIFLGGVKSLSCGLIQVTPGRARCLYVVGNTILMCRVLVADPSPYFYMLNGMRASYRAACTLAIFDTRLSWVVNSAWSGVLIYFEVSKQQSLPPSSISLNSPAIMIVWELSTLAFLLGLSWFAEEFVETHVRLNLGVISARNVQQAVRRILSVLCDAELHLSPTLEIRYPSRKAAHLLAPDKQAGPAAIAGRSFEDFIAEADQERFREFLSASAGATSAGAEPPRSTQLRLCDSTGCSVPVEIFHANLPDVESSRRPGHLLGIRECGPGHKEVSALAEPRGPTLGPGCPRQPLPPNLQDGREGRPGPSASPRNGNAGGDGASEGSSRSAASVATVVRRISLPELAGIEIRFDGLDGRMSVKDLRCRFAANRVASTPQQLPSLPDWVHRSMRKGLKDWIQENVNSVCSGRECGSPFAPLMLQWPFGGDAREEPLVLEATEVSLGVPDSDDEEADEEEEEELEEEMDMVLKLSSFNQVSMLPGRHHRPRSVRSTHSAARSTRGFGSGAQQLPSIGEAGTDRGREQQFPSIGEAGTDRGRAQQLPSIGTAGAAQSREPLPPMGAAGADQSNEPLPPTGEAGADQSEERLPPIGEAGVDDDGGASSQAS